MVGRSDVGCWRVVEMVFGVEKDWRGREMVIIVIMEQIMS